MSIIPFSVFTLIHSDIPVSRTIEPRKLFMFAFRMPQCFPCIISTMTLFSHERCQPTT